MFGRIVPIMKKEFRQVKRDRRTLGMLLVIPAFLLIMYGYALNFDVKHIRLGLCDLDKTQASREFTRQFFHSEYFDIKYFLVEQGEADHFLDRGAVQAVMTIPAGFSRDLLAGKNVSVQVIVDGEEGTAAGTIIGYTNAFIQSYSSRVLFKNIERRGGRNFVLPVDFRPRVLFNPELRSAKFLVPGLMAFILMITVVISTSFSVVREKEFGTMEQIVVSPVKPAELIAGKTVPYIFISLVSAHLVLLFGYLLFGVSIKGNYLWLFLAMLLFLTSGLGMGLFISTIARSQQVAFLLAIITTLLPTFLLSGFVFPIRNMPSVIQGISYLIPARYFLVALRSILLKGVGISAFWSQMVFLAVFALMTVVLSSARMRRNQTAR